MTDQDEPALTSDVPGAELGRKAPSHRGLRIASAAGVVVGLTVGAGAVASAATGGSGASAPAASQGTGASSSGTMHGHCSAAAFGTVKSVGTDSFTVATLRGTTVIVDVSSTTTYRDREVASPTLANIKAGENVAVFGSETTGTVKATAVGIRQAGGRWGGRGHRWSGSSLAMNRR